MSSIRVPFLDLQREYSEYGNKLVKKVQTALASGRFILDEETAAFEGEFSTYIGTNYSIGVNSGSDALYLAMQAIGVEGHEVIIPSHTFISTADAVVRNGGIPVFVDVDPETYTIDPEAVAEHVNNETAAIVPVHLYGQPADVDPILEIAEEHDAAVVEDASQAHGSTYRGDPVGSLGDIACFSLYPTKNLGAYGDAGIVVTDDDDLAERVSMAREYGASEKYRYEFVGVNSRLDEIQAAMLRYKLTRLDELNERRREVAASYDDLLDGVSTPTVEDDRTHVYHLYVVETDDREEFRSYLDNHGVQTLVHYPTPVHEQPAYEGVGKRGDLSVTERVADRIVSLPMHPWCREEEIARVADVVAGFDDA
ncbi:DegT/DnrJ/EryC1/StrS family aminotransferase [Halorubrum salinum]|uniref:DegT/DnrJ/EryC1/StrS family aminotransferase n=1 Tax=Halorubrum salinum TaxID=767517 RepID=UPI00211211E1|nr:DegT/DnrJ/EryC1/StrS family aminotransferase [Halorubrum salinum]